MTMNARERSRIIGEFEKYAPDTFEGKWPGQAALALELGEAEAELQILRRQMADLMSRVDAAVESVNDAVKRKREAMSAIPFQESGDLWRLFEDKRDTVCKAAVEAHFKPPQRHDGETQAAADPKAAKTHKSSTGVPRISDHGFRTWTKGEAPTVYVDTHVYDGLVGSYSADVIASKGSLRQPYKVDNTLYVSMGGHAHNSRETPIMAWECMPYDSYPAPSYTYSEKSKMLNRDAGKEEFYEGMIGTWKNKRYVLTRPVNFVWGQSVEQQPEPEPKAELPPEPWQPYQNPATAIEAEFVEPVASTLADEVREQGVQHMKYAANPLPTTEDEFSSTAAAEPDQYVQGVRRRKAQRVALKRKAGAV